MHAVLDNLTKFLLPVLPDDHIFNSTLMDKVCVGLCECVCDGEGVSAYVCMSLCACVCVLVGVSVCGLDFLLHQCGVFSQCLRVYSCAPQLRIINATEALAHALVRMRLLCASVTDLVLSRHK